MPVFFHFFYIIIKVGHFEVLCFHEYSSTTVNIFSILSFPSNEFSSLLFLINVANTFIQFPAFYPVLNNKVFEQLKKKCKQKSTFFSTLLLVFPCFCSFFYFVALVKEICMLAAFYLLPLLLSHVGEAVDFPPLEIFKTILTQDAFLCNLW